jgi:hypothetical protein
MQQSQFRACLFVNAVFCAAVFFFGETLIAMEEGVPPPGGGGQQGNCLVITSFTKLNASKLKVEGSNPNGTDVLVTLTLPDGSTLGTFNVSGGSFWCTISCDTGNFDPGMYTVKCVNAQNSNDLDTKQLTIQ